VSSQIFDDWRDSVAKTKRAKPATKPSKPASKTGGAAKRPARKERGALLSFLIVLVMLHGILAAYLAFSSLKEEYRNSTTWILIVLGLISLADILAAIAMWRWKKWGIALYGVTRAAATVVHLMLTGSLLVVFYDLLPVAFLGYVINLQSKRNLFE
jgi:hypothetical protein